MMKSKLRTVGAATLAAVLMGSPLALAQSAGQAATQVPPTDQSNVNWKGVGVAAGTVASNVLYIPAKLAYGILGGIGGAGAWALTGGNTQVANTVWRSSLGGDYVLTPDMLTGKQPIYFSGPNKTAAPGPGASNASAGSTAVAASNNPANATGSYYPASHPIDNGAGPIGSGSGVSSQPIGSSRTVPAAPISYPPSSGASTARSAAPASNSSIE
jgi:hypothetical protein